jgi:hypothetical protein
MRIYVDFNTMTVDAQERVSINPDVQRDPSMRFHAGQHVVLYDEEMEVEGTIEFDTEHQQWFAQPHWTTRRDVSVPEKHASKVA